jgi:hypothetical protein
MSSFGGKTQSNIDEKTSLEFFFQDSMGLFISLSPLSFLSVVRLIVVHEWSIRQSIIVFDFCQIWIIIMRVDLRSMILQFLAPQTSSYII